MYYSLKRFQWETRIELFHLAILFILGTIAYLAVIIDPYLFLGPSAHYILDRIEFDCTIATTVTYWRVLPSLKVSLAHIQCQFPGKGLYCSKVKSSAIEIKKRRKEKTPVLIQIKLHIKNKK